MEINEVIQKVLNEASLMSLATNDDSGPWSSILAFISDDKYNIYWISDEESRHSKAIEKSGIAAASITLTKTPEDDNIALQIFGEVKKLEGNFPNLDIKFLNKRSNLLYTPRHVIDDNKKWYILTPKYIDVTYEPEWSFIKKRYEK